MSLYLKYRPGSWDEVRGNEETVSVLKGMLADRNTCPHSFLLTGPTGCGKTTVGRLIAKTLDCSGDDFTEVDSADFRGIDTVRDIRTVSQYAPRDSSCRVWLIDEVHKMTNDAQNALLKILEDTPAHVYFILATTDPQKLLPTIKGRCSTFQVKPLTETQMMALLISIARAEGVALPKVVYQQIAQDSFGFSRNAIQVLEQVIKVEPEKRLEAAKQYAEQQSQTIELCRALFSKTPWKLVATVLEGLKDQEPENIRRAVLGYAQAVLLKSDNVLAGYVLQAFSEPYYNVGFPGLVLSCYSVVKRDEFGQ